MAGYFARERADGRLEQVTWRDPEQGDVEVIAPPGFMGPMALCDQTCADGRCRGQGARHVVEHGALALVRVREKRRARAIAAETRLAILQRIRQRFMAIGRQAPAWVGADIAAADAEVVDALRDET